MEKKYQTGLDLKSLNRNNVFRSVWAEDRTSKQKLMQELGLSLPTVTQNLNELVAEGLIVENGAFGNTGGRNARGYSVVPSARFALGLDINKTHISAVAVDLKGNIVCSEHLHTRFNNSESYYKQVGEIAGRMIHTAGINAANLLGTGISIQGLVSLDRQTVTFGPILDIVGEPVSVISHFIPFKCELFHDADSAAFAELWVSPEIRNAIYISLSTNLGGSLIMNREIFSGNNYMAGLVEHMTLIPDGKTCYCGRQGCAEVYCNAQNLTEGMGDGTLEHFFERLGEGEAEAKARWDRYTESLALFLNSLHSLIDSDIILGGYIGPYLGRYLDELKEKTYARRSFDTKTDYLKLGKSQTEPIATGAALRYVDAFIRTI